MKSIQNICIRTKGDKSCQLRDEERGSSISFCWEGGFVEAWPGGRSSLLDIGISLFSQTASGSAK